MEQFRIQIRLHNISFTDKKAGLLVEVGIVWIFFLLVVLVPILYIKKMCNVMLCIIQVRPQHVRLSMRVNEAYDMDFYYAQVNIVLMANIFVLRC